MPFPADLTHDELAEEISTAGVEFPEDEWAMISQEVKTLIKRLLCVDSEKRMSASELLHAEWLQHNAQQFERAPPGVNEIPSIAERFFRYLPNFCVPTSNRLHDDEQHIDGYISEDNDIETRRIGRKRVGAMTPAPALKSEPRGSPGPERSNMYIDSDKTDVDCSETFSDGGDGPASNKLQQLGASGKLRNVGGINTGTGTNTKLRPVAVSKQNMKVGAANRGLSDNMRASADHEDELPTRAAASAQGRRLMQSSGMFNSMDSSGDFETYYDKSDSRASSRTTNAPAQKRQLQQPSKMFNSMDSSGDYETFQVKPTDSPSTDHTRNPVARRTQAPAAAGSYDSFEVESTDSDQSCRPYKLEQSYPSSSDYVE